MKTYRSDIHASLGGIQGAGERCKCEISQVWGVGWGSWLWPGNL